MLLNVSKLAVGRVLSEWRPGLFSLSDGIRVSAVADDVSGYFSSRDDAGGFIVRHGTISDLMTALGDLVSGVERDAYAPALRFRGVMLDASRGGVPTVDYLKGRLVGLALLGFNRFCLYTEDTYEVDGEPLIGYNRGRYSKDELRGLSVFAAELGIEMFPCIQTLGHLEQILKYERYADMRDTKRVLNVRFDEVRGFVGKLIAEAAVPYESRLIHIGMDEPWGLGRGEAFVEGVPIEPLELYSEQVAMVAEICAELGLKPIMWGDVVLGRSGGRSMSDAEKAALPENMGFDYWNYYSESAEDYERDIAAFAKVGRMPLFSPGIHAWNRFFPDWELTKRTASVGMLAALDGGVEGFLATIWGDDGSEALFGYVEPLVAWLAGAARGEEDGDTWLARAEAILGVSPEWIDIVKSIEAVDADTRGEGHLSAKALFYDDPLMGAATRLLSDPVGVAAEFARISQNAAEVAEAMPREGGKANYLDVASRFMRIISRKIELIASAASLYGKGDNVGVGKLERTALELAEEVRDFRGLYAALWRGERKPFGLEIVEGRLAALEARLETMASRMSAFATSAISSIEEFDEPPPSELIADDLKFHARMVSRCMSIWK